MENISSVTLSVNEAAALLGVSKQTIYRHVELGDIAAVKLGKTTRILKAPLLERLNLPDDMSARLQSTLETVPCMYGGGGSAEREILVRKLIENENLKKENEKLRRELDELLKKDTQQLKPKRQEVLPGG